jgi:hypothetical protein
VDVEGAKGEGRRIGKGNGRVNIIESHCMHVWKCHNETPYLV